VNKRRSRSRDENKPQGSYATVSTVGGERVRAFVPAPLPPDLELSPGVRRAFDRALLALGRLDGISAFLPDPDVFLYTYVRKEAVLSSQIEGTQSSLSDLLQSELDEAPGVPVDDVAEVSNYVAALDHGLGRLRGGFPLSNRLLREIHAILLRSGRGAAKQPGEFRRSQNWIGGTRPGNAVFVPPPPDRVEGLMAALERFLHAEPDEASPILEAALAHVQFETIHPFLDGNGRVGRLLIALILVNGGVLRQPLLAVSITTPKRVLRAPESSMSAARGRVAASSPRACARQPKGRDHRTALGLHERLERVTPPGAAGRPRGCSPRFASGRCGPSRSSRR
jgi:Fic family protein